MALGGKLPENQHKPGQMGGGGGQERTGPSGRQSDVDRGPKCPGGQKMND